MSWSPYNGDEYLDFPETEAWCRDLVEAPRLDDPSRDRHESRGASHLAFDLVGDQSADLDAQPAFWLDGGTHAAEWTGVMAVLHTLSRWAERLDAGDAETIARFKSTTAYVAPCIGQMDSRPCVKVPFLRSSRRPPLPGTHAVGLRPSDLTGDGAIRWMRWKHEAGPWVADPEAPMCMRHRASTIDQRDAFFFCSEGTFIHWDGVALGVTLLEVRARSRPQLSGSWAPFRMFGMDGSAYPLGEPESRGSGRCRCGGQHRRGADHTRIRAAFSRSPIGISPAQAERMISSRSDWQEGAVEGTKVSGIRPIPDFVYDPKVDIVGVWSNTLSTTFGIPGYPRALESYSFAGIEIEHGTGFFDRIQDDSGSWWWRSPGSSHGRPGLGGSPRLGGRGRRHRLHADHSQPAGALALQRRSVAGR